MNVDDVIIQIREDVFENKFNDVVAQVLNLVSYINEEMGNIIDNCNRRELFNEIISMINISIENKDYLLLVDILTYEFGNLFI